VREKEIREQKGRMHARGEEINFSLSEPKVSNTIMKSSHSSNDDLNRPRKIPKCNFSPTQNNP
jgi:hypothetical protein